MTHYLIQCDASDVKLDAWRELQIFESFHLKPDEPRSTGADGRHSAVGGTVLMICQTWMLQKSKFIYHQKYLLNKRVAQSVVWFFNSGNNILLNNLIVEGARCFFF